MTSNLPEACQTCGLHEGCKSYRIRGDGTDTPRILFVGEAPGAEEDKKGVPFVGRSGLLLRATVQKTELTPADVRYTNVVRCRPPDNRDPKPKEVAACMPFLLEEIKECKPAVIVLLGNVPLKVVLGESGITHWNGVVVERESATYVPMFHPAYVLRRGGRDSSAITEWIDALYKAIDAADGKVQGRADSHFKYLFPKTMDDIIAMRDELMRADFVTYDIETDSIQELYEGNRVLTVAFASEQKAWSFPIDHGESWWSEDEREAIISMMSEVLNESGGVIGHFVKFDCKLTRRLLDIDFIPTGDTIHLSMILNAHYLEHGLKRLAGLRLGMFDYDRELREYCEAHPEADPSKGGTYGNVPLSVLLPYGGMDVAATRLLHDDMYPQLTPKQRAIYEELNLPADYTLGRMESAGLNVDRDLAYRYVSVYEAVKEEYYQRMLDDHDVQDLIIVTREEKPKFWFNPNSSPQVGAVLYDRKGFEPPAYTPTGKPSIKRDLLKEIIFDLGDTKCQFLDDYMNWKLLSTILSKVFYPLLRGEGDWYDPDGRVRTSFTVGGAKTGRTSSKKPNLQNIPTPEKEPGTLLQHLPAKNCFTHTWPDGCLLMVDFSGMELRVISSVAGIKGMVEVFARGGDVHRYVSSLIYGIPEEEITKFQRYRGKWCNWSLLYLGNWWTLYRMYRINGLTESEAKRVTKLYFNSFPELSVYHGETISFAEEHGYVESPFGRVLQLPTINSRVETVRKDTQRTAVNMPIQGTASDVLLLAMYIVDQFLYDKGLKSYLVNTVHDSIVLDIYPGELEEVQAMCIDVMENIVSYAQEFAPNLDFSWLRVPLKADADIGTHYGSYGLCKRAKCDHCDSHSVVFERIDIDDLIYRCQDCNEHTTIITDFTDYGDVMLYNQVHPDIPKCNSEVLRQYADQNCKVRAARRR